MGFGEHAGNPGAAGQTRNCLVDVVVIIFEHLKVRNLFSEQCFCVSPLDSHLALFGVLGLRSPTPGAE